MVDSNCIKEVMIFHSVDFYLISLKEFSTVKARNNLHRDLKAIIDVAAATYSARKSLTTKKHIWIPIATIISFCILELSVRES